MAILAECPICHTKQAVKNKVCKCGYKLDKAKRSKKVRYWISYHLPAKKVIDKNGNEKTVYPQRREICDRENPYSIEIAQAAHGKRVSQKYENPSILEKVPEAKMTFQELTDWYLGLEKVKALKSYHTTEIYLDKFNNDFGNTLVGQIMPVDLENLQIRRKKEKSNADATIDQELRQVRVMINKAFENDLVGGNTLKVFRRVKKLLKKNANARKRVLTPAEFNDLIDHAATHTKQALAIAYYTGMRLSEVLTLTWDKLDLKRGVIRLEAEDTKDKEARGIPIGKELHHILTSIPRDIRDRHVILHDGAPVGSINRSVQTACKNAGIVYGRDVKDGFVYHDLRHTFNTYMRKAGVEESVIMAITGHATREMFDRYNTIDAEDTHQAMRQFEGFLQDVDQTVDQKANS